MRALIASCLAAAALAAPCADGEQCLSQPPAADDSAMLQLRRKGDKSARIGSRKTVPTSVYFLLVDRFARSDGNSTECSNDNDWCGGTLRGVINNLDYIQNMGFDSIWINPVVQQYDGPRTPSGTGCMGYWAYDLYKIDPRFGSEDDMKELVQELHRRNMTIVYDFVANHMGPIHNEDMVKKMNPFNKPEYFHQLFRGNMTFNEYVAKDSAWPPPAQAMWSQSGAQCTQGADCTCWVCDKSKTSLGVLGETADDSGCDGEMVFNETSLCPKGALSKYCMPGDYECKGYNQTITWEGWFYDLGDLDQDNEFVKKAELEWIAWFVKKYDIDYLRLDTAGFMSFDFLHELQEAAGVSIMGEVTTTNLTYHAQFQSDPPAKDSQTVLDGVLNFPLYYSAISGFCGHWWPYSTWNLTFLGERMTAQAQAPYRSLERLGNFIDNHDADRVTKFCKKDHTRVHNALVWTMMAQGTPIIYYGTEEDFSETRHSLWQMGFKQNTTGFQFIKKLNEIRAGIPSDASQSIVPTADHGTLVFKRGEETLVYTHNLADGSTASWCDAPPPAAKEGHEWINAFTGLAPPVDSNGCISSQGPVVLVHTKISEKQA